MIIDEIETLHDIARGVSVAIPAAEYGNEMLHEIIERIACQLDSEKSIWQKIADERYPAWEWVEAHGGIDAVKRRLMPEGMEWPRYESGEQVHIGDYVQTEAGAEKLHQVHVCREGYYVCTDTRDEWHRYGERVKRPEPPAPKVLDADGVEIEVGDDLYSVEGMLKFHVSAIDKKGGRIATEAMFALDKWADPKMYTHRAPVLAADGMPLREGETVWDKDSGDRFEVNGFSDDGFAVCWDLDKCEADIEIRPSQLTHERPVADSWERLEDDATMPSATYCERMGIVDDGGYSPEELMARDLVRRAKKLAGVSE